MDDSQQIERLIQVMQELQGMCRTLNNSREENRILVGLMVALIMSTPIPDVTILPNSRSIAYA
tara:strand:- start:172 stop:360 length:189 start_codon:yes stop_codon:yes gene_type:complete